MLKQAKSACAVWRLILAFPVLVMISQANLSAQDARPGKTLSESTRRVVFDGSAFVGETTAMPQWDKGYLVSREILSYKANVPNVRMYDQSGRKVREAVIWFPGSQRVVIYSAVASFDGKIIAAGNAEKSDGTSAPFIALTDLAGEITNVIQTKGYAPSNICQAPDGTVWSFGGTGYDQQTGPNPGDTFRHFDFGKGEVGSYIPRSAFPDHPMPDKPAYIRCSVDRVVVYSPAVQGYIEMKYGEDTPVLYHAEGAPSDLLLVGLAVTGGPRNAYGFFSRGAKNGLYYLSFNDAARTVRWLPVEGTVNPRTTQGAITGLWGSDGDSLVVSRSDDSAGEHAIHWTAPIER